MRVKPEKACRLCRLRRANRRAAAVVEFAVVAPLFFLIVFGMIEFGRMVMVQQVVTNASREGARVAAQDGTTAAEVSSTVTNYLTAARLSGGSVTIVPADPTSAAYGAPVSVTVQIPFSQVSWLPSPMFVSGSTQLTATTVMRREQVP